jgi:hypothetical protein
MQKGIYVTLVILAAVVVAGAAVYSLQARPTNVQQQNTTSTVQETVITTTTIIQVEAEGPISVISGNVSYSYDNKTGITTITNSTSNATISVKEGQRIELASPSIVLPSSNLTNYSNGSYQVLKSGNLVILKATYNATYGIYNLMPPWNYTALYQSLRSERNTQYCNVYTGLSSILAPLPSSLSIYKIQNSSDAKTNYTDILIKPGNQGAIHYYVYNSRNLTTEAGLQHKLYLGATIMQNSTDANYGSLNPATKGINISLSPNTINTTALVPNSMFLINVTISTKNNAGFGSYVLTLFPSWCNGAEEPLYVLTVGNSAYVGVAPKREIVV